MKFDPVLQMSGPYIKQVLEILRTERNNLVKRIRSNYTQEPGNEEIEVVILGTSELTLKQIKSSIVSNTEQIYLSAVSRSISDVSRTDIYRPTAIPAYISQQDKDDAKTEAEYPFKLISDSFDQRNEEIGKIIMSRKKGMTTLIEEVVGQINKIWIPRMEEDIRIGMNHAYNAGYFTRVIEFGTYKQWILGNCHEPMNGVILPVDEPFTVPEFSDPTNIVQKIPGCEMMYPGDYSGNPDRRQLINCYCRIGPAKSMDQSTLPPEPEKKTRRKKKNEN